MSLVGTRPPTVDEWDKYELHHRARLATKPGLTGMWQVSGRSNITDFEEVVKLDKQYISEWTILFGILYASRCNNFHGNVAARMNSINADRETFKMYTDIFLVEYIILAIHMNCRGQLSDQVLERMKSNSEIML